MNEDFDEQEWFQALLETTAFLMTETEFNEETGECGAVPVPKFLSMGVKWLVDQINQHPACAGRLCPGELLD